MMKKWSKELAKKWLVNTGRRINEFMIYTGRIALLFVQTVRLIFSPPVLKSKHIFSQM